MIDQIIKSTPIPGMSLTVEKGNRPWEQPPQFVKFDDIVGYYVDLITDEDNVKMFIDTMQDGGAPLLYLANVLVKAGLMRGIHTVDACTVVLPIVVELLKSLCEIYNVEYVVDNNKTEERKPTVGMIRKLIESGKEEVEQTLEKSSGLMSKGAK